MNKSDLDNDQMLPRHQIWNRLRLGAGNRQSLIFFSIFFLANGLIYLLVVPQLQNQLTTRKQENLANYSSLFAESFYSAVNQGTSPVYQQLLTQQYAEKADARIIVLNSSGGLVANSLKNQSFEPSDYADTAQQAMGNKEPITQPRQIGEQNYMLAAAPIGDPTHIYGAVVIQSSMADVESSVALVERQVGIAAGVALLIALAAIYLSSRKFARRISRMENGAPAHHPG